MANENKNIINMRHDALSTNKVSAKHAFKNWSKWINWALLFTMLAEIAVPYVYGFYRNTFISRIDGENDSLSLYLASTSQLTSVFFYVIKDIFILGIYSYFGRAAKSNNKDIQAASIKNIWLTISITMLVVCLGATTYVWLHIDNGSVANNIDEAIESGMDGLDKDLLLHQAAINYTLSIWTQLLKLIAISSFLMIMFSGKTNLLAILVVVRLVTWISLDAILFIPSTTITDLGFLGVSISDFTSEVVVSIVGIIMVLSIYKISVKLLFKSKWFYKTSQLYRVASWSGAESLIRNMGYTFVILMILNQMGSDDFTGWLYAISFYWSFLLVPLYAIQEVIIKDIATSDDEALIRKRSLAAGHIYIFVLVMCWIPFLVFGDNLLAHMTNSDVHPGIFENAVSGIYILFIPMICYAFSRLWDQYFYASGQARVIFLRTIIASSIVFLPVYLIWIFNPSSLSFNDIAFAYGMLLVVEALIIWIYLLIRTKTRKNVGNFNERAYAIERKFDEAFSTGELTFSNLTWKQYQRAKKNSISIINQLEKANRKIKQNNVNASMYELQKTQLHYEWITTYLDISNSLHRLEKQLGIDLDDELFVKLNASFEHIEK